VGKKWAREEEEQPGDHMARISTVTRRRFPRDCVRMFEGFKKCWVYEWISMLQIDFWDGLGTH
jgi:hypothetical protein